jgi:hypothetical protein
MNDPAAGERAPSLEMRVSTVLAHPHITGTRIDKIAKCLIP